MRSRWLSKPTGARLKNKPLWVHYIGFIQSTRYQLGINAFETFITFTISVTMSSNRWLNLFFGCKTIKLYEAKVRPDGERVHQPAHQATHQPAYQPAHQATHKTISSMWITYKQSICIDLIETNFECVMTPPSEYKYRLNNVLST